MTNRALLGQKPSVGVDPGAVACARVVDTELLARPTAAALVVVINVLRFIWLNSSGATCLGSAYPLSLAYAAGAGGLN
jgi:hypothetical protein